VCHSADDQSIEEGVITLSPRNSAAASAVVSHAVPTPQQLAFIAALPQDQQFRQLQVTHCLCCNILLNADLPRGVVWCGVVGW
jgi:hypothetical protein